MVKLTQYYPIAKGGLASEFSESTQPIEYSRRFTNRYLNSNGDAEKRKGMEQLGSTISGDPTLDAIHEWVNIRTGESKTFVSSKGNIWRYNSVTDGWDKLSISKADETLISIQMGDKLIFVNGVDRNFYTDDGGDTFKELVPLMHRGVAASGTGSLQIKDATITNWSSQTLVQANDLVYVKPREAYSLITKVSADALEITQMGIATNGISRTNLGSPSPGDAFEVYDLVELNVINTGLGFDNTSVMTTAGTTETVVAVSGQNFLDTEIEVGDYIYNSTRNAITQVSAISTAELTVVRVSGQTAGDSFILFKKAMPIATWAHVHYSRAYYIDSRNNGKVVISGINDPEDMTSYQQTLNSISLDYGSRQPEAERLISLASFGKYLVAGGDRNVYADDGQNPILDTTASTTDLAPIGSFPQGCVSRFGLASIGNDMVFAANDGLRSFKAIYDFKNLDSRNLSEVIKSEVATLIEDKVESNSTDEIKVIHYPRRNWVMYKIGSVIYNYNYTPIQYRGELAPTQGTWSKFTGLFAQQNAYKLTKSGDLLCCGDGGRVYKFDNGYADGDEEISTVYETSFLSLEEPQKSSRTKSGSYIIPVFETTHEIPYTISVQGDFDNTSNDSVTVTSNAAGVVGAAVVGSSPVGGNPVSNKKLPLRWRGEEFKIRIENSSKKGSDTITGFTIYGNILGNR